MLGHQHCSACYFPVRVLSCHRRPRLTNRPLPPPPPSAGFYPIETSNPARAVMSFLNVKWAVSLLMFARSFRRRMVDDGFDYRSLSGEPCRVTRPGPAGPGPGRRTVQASERRGRYGRTRRGA